MDEGECPAKIRLATKYADCFQRALDAVCQLPSKVGSPGFDRYLSSTEKLLKSCKQARKTLGQHIRLHKPQREVVGVVCSFP